MLSDESLKFITSQYKKRRRAAKILTWFFTPFALLFLYAFVMVLLEEKGLQSLLAEGGVAAVAFFPIIIFSAIYPLLNLIKLRAGIKKLPEFKVGVVEGIPKLKEHYYRHTFRASSGAIYGAHQKIGFTGVIDGVKYDFRAVRPSVIASLPMRFTAITRRSWLFLCSWKNFIVELQELSQDEIKKYEANRLVGWPKGRYAEAISSNRAGQLSNGQIKMLRRDKFKTGLLLFFLLCCGVLLMSVGGMYLLTGGGNNALRVGSIALAVLGSVGSCIAIYALARELFSAGVTSLPVRSFTGVAKKTRAATPSESRQSGKELVTAPTVAFGDKTFFMLPEALFNEFPTTRKIKYYYIQKDKERYGTVINFEYA